MKKKVILFDLDGTLLPMNSELFTRMYFSMLVKKLEDLGFSKGTPEEQEALGKAIWTSVYAMMKNDGSCTNEERFFSTFFSLTGIDIASKKSEFDEFYKNEFQTVKGVCGENPLVAQAVYKLKSEGYRMAVATNPLFPLCANINRLEWAGFSLDEFEYCTCYENSGYCKPNLKYYEAVLARLGVGAEDCIMVGNDAKEDMAARELGIDVFLITDCLVNTDNRDISEFPRGNWQDFLNFMEDKGRE